jgi:hypothetical protein
VYKDLQCYARTRLNEKYGDTVQPRTGGIRADLLGDMWAQSWGNVYDLLAPTNADLGYDLTPSLAKQNYDAVKLASLACRRARLHQRSQYPQAQRALAVELGEREGAP